MRMRKERESLFWQSLQARRRQWLTEGRKCRIAVLCNGGAFLKIVAATSKLVR
jgi:hypothetical protein